MTVLLEPCRTVRILRPRGEDGVGRAIRELVGRVVAVAGHRRHHDGRAEEAQEQGDLHRYVDDHRLRPALGDEGRESGHPVAESRIVTGRPVQQPVHVDIDRMRVGVVAIETDDLGERGVVQRGAGQRHDVGPDVRGDRRGPRAMPLSLVVDVVADHDGTFTLGRCARRLPATICS